MKELTTSQTPQIDRNYTAIRQQYHEDIEIEDAEIVDLVPYEIDLTPVVDTCLRIGTGAAIVTGQVAWFTIVAAAYVAKFVGQGVWFALLGVIDIVTECVSMSRRVSVDDPVNVNVDVNVDTDSPVNVDVNVNVTKNHQS